MSRFLEAFAEKVKELNLNIYRVSEIKGHGEAETLQLIDCNPCQDSYSIAKMFTVSAIGLLFDQGKLTPHDRIAAILSIPKGADPRWQTVTVDMLLRHRVGFSKSFLDIDLVDPRSFGQDYLAYIFSQPLLCEPDTERTYSDAAHYVLSCAVERLVGMPMDAFLWTHLLTPLGFSEVAWSKCPMGHVMGGTGLYLKSEDMVKLGELYHNRGTYRGRRLLSKAWCDMVYEREYDLRRSKYGEAFRKGGFRGQMLIILPKQERTVAWHGFLRTPIDPLEEWVCNYSEE